MAQTQTMTTTLTGTVLGGLDQAGAAVVGFAAARWNGFKAWRMRRATRSILSGLDDTMLKDIGLSRSEIGSLVFDGSDRHKRIDPSRPFVRYY